MKLFAIITALLFSLHAFGQGSDSIISLLRGKNFPEFRSFLCNPRHGNGNLNSLNNTLREMIPDYWEGIIELTNSKKDNQAWHQQYRLDLLATAQNIFYYRINRIIYQVKEDGLEYPVDSLIETFRDDTIYQGFKKSFLTTCGLPMKYDELFLLSAVYGDACGIGGSPPQERERLMSLLSKQDYNAIASWLRSPNVERQLYAMEGLKTLENNGIVIKDEDIALMAVLKVKKGMVRTCAGCFWEMESTKAVAQRIDTMTTTFSFPPKSSLKKSTLYSGLGTLLLLSIGAGIYYKTKRSKKQD